MISESITYVRNSENWVRTVLIGGLLSLLTVFVVPAFMLTGYALRVLRATMRGDDQPPAFDDWGDLTVDGLKGFVIAAVYALIPAVVGIGIAAVAGIGVGLGGDSGLVAGAGLLVAMVGLLLTLVLGLVAFYVIPAALANYAEEGRIGAGFDFGELRPVLTSGTYATGWLMAAAVVFAAAVVSAVLNVIPFLGLLVGAFLGFYAAVAAYYIIGRTWAKLHPVAIQEEELADERAAI